MKRTKYRLIVEGIKLQKVTLLNEYFLIENLHNPEELGSSGKSIIHSSILFQLQCIKKFDFM